MRANGLAVPGVVNGPFMGWAAVAIGLVVAAQPMNLRKPVADPGPAVVLSAVFKNAQFGDKGVHFGRAVSGLVVAQGLGQGIGPGIDHNPQGTWIVLSHCLDNELRSGTGFPLTHGIKAVTRLPGRDDAVQILRRMPAGGVLLQIGIDLGIGINDPCEQFRMKHAPIGILRLRSQIDS